MDVLDKNTVEMPKTARAHPLTDDGVDEEFSNGCNLAYRKKVLLETNPIVEEH
jgi:hypothetical protein